MKKQLIWIISIIVIIIIILIIIFVPKNKSKNNQQTIKIGAALALTGDASLYGENEKNGIMLAVKEINENPNNKTKIDLIVEDMKTTNKYAISAIRKLQSSDNVDSLIVTWLDTFGGAIPVINENILTFSASAWESLNEEILHKNIFTIWYDSKVKTEKILQYLSKNNKNKMYLIIQNDPYYLLILRRVKELAKKYNIEIVGEDILNPSGVSDLKNILTKIKTKDTEAVFVGLYNESQIYNLYSNKNVLNKDVWFVTDENFESFINNPENKKYAEGVHYYTAKDPNQNFIEKYKNQYGTLPKIAASHSYDSVYIIYDYLTKNPSKNNKDSIYKYLLSKTFPSVTYKSEIKFLERGNVENKLYDFQINKIENNEKIVVEE